MLLEAVATAVAAGAGAVLYRRRQVSPDTSHKALAVVVTGSTRGLGLAMAKEFVACGDSVVINGRTEQSVQAAVASLENMCASKGQRVVGFACDVATAEGCEGLAATASKELGKIDMWINNAGQTQKPKAFLHQTPPDTLTSVVGTNLYGTLFGCRAALTVMLPQVTQHQHTHRTACEATATSPQNVLNQLTPPTP